MHPFATLTALVLLAVANGTPVVAAKLFGKALAWPLDGGVRFHDRRPLFGPSKTVRGLLLSIALTALAALLLGIAAATGALVGAAAMAGDLLSSFVKRRLALPASSRATGLDQIPEALLPLLACRLALPLSLVDIAIGIAVFFVGEVVLSRLLYRLGLRDRPY